MYNKNGIRLIALSIIIQAINDLYIPSSYKYAGYIRRTAKIFFQSKYRYSIAFLAGITDINYVYRQYKDNPKKKIRLHKKGRINERIHLL